MNNVSCYQSLVLKELKAICKFSRLLNIGAIKLRKLNLQTSIPKEPWCFYATPTHLPKPTFSHTENRNVQACEGALKGFLFESSFSYDTCINAFVLFLGLNFVSRTIEDFSAFTVTRNAAKISFVHVDTIEHPLTIKSI